MNNAGPGPRFIRGRLALMMFLQFFAAGAYTPLFSLYCMGRLHFTGGETGLILSLTSLGAIVSPLVVANIADRLIRAERLLALCNLCGGALMLVFGMQRAFLPTAAAYLAYTIITVPTFALTNAISFHHAPGGRASFGSVRVWGTLGWIAAAWFIGMLWLRGTSGEAAAGRIAEAIRISAAASLLLGIYAFTLPSNRARSPSGDARLLPRDALRIFRRPPVALFCLFMLAVTLIDRFYYFGTAPFLRATGFTDRSIMPAMSLGQIPEVFGMVLLAWLLRKHGLKKVIAIGIALDCFRFATCAAGGPMPLLLVGLALHGLAYTFIYTTASIYLDSFCDTTSRTGAHQIFTLLTSGVGNFSGNLLAGMVLDNCVQTAGPVNYHAFWTMPSIATAALLAAFLFFRYREKQAPRASL